MIFTAAVLLFLALVSVAINVKSEGETIYPVRKLHTYTKTLELQDKTPMRFRIDTLQYGKVMQAKCESKLESEKYF